MRTKNRRYKYTAMVIGLLTAGLLTGCTMDNTQVRIVDGREQTTISVPAKATVQEVLAAAEIPVYQQDQVTPALDHIIKAEEDITIERYAKVTFVEDGKTSEVELTGKKVKDLLDKQGVTLKDHDYLNHAVDAYLSDGMRIEVTHRMEVTVQVDGKKETYLTKATDVAGLLEEQNIALDQKDIVKPGRDKVLTEGMDVVVERVSVKEVVEKEKVPFETEVEYSDSMYSDETVEKTPGVDGEKEVTYQVTYVDGKEDNRKAVAEKMLKEPVSQVVTKGTKSRRTIVSKQKVPDCDGSGHGYYIITYSDGTVDYKDY